MLEELSQRSIQNPRNLINREQISLNTPDITPIKRDIYGDSQNSNQVSVQDQQLQFGDNQFNFLNLDDQQYDDDQNYANQSFQNQSYQNYNKSINQTYVQKDINQHMDDLYQKFIQKKSILMSAQPEKKNKQNKGDQKYSEWMIENDIDCEQKQTVKMDSESLEQLAKQMLEFQPQINNPWTYELNVQVLEQLNNIPQLQIQQQRYEEHQFEFPELHANFQYEEEQKNYEYDNQTFINHYDEENNHFNQIEIVESEEYDLKEKSHQILQNIQQTCSRQKEVSFDTLHKNSKKLYSKAELFYEILILTKSQKINMHQENSTFAPITIKLRD